MGGLGGFAPQTLAVARSRAAEEILSAGERVADRRAALWMSKD
jgi:hypothetical protein